MWAIDTFYPYKSPDSDGIILAMLQYTGQSIIPGGMSSDEDVRVEGGVRVEGVRAEGVRVERVIMRRVKMGEEKLGREKLGGERMGGERMGGVRIGGIRMEFSYHFPLPHYSLGGVHVKTKKVRE